MKSAAPIGRPLTLSVSKPRAPPVLKASLQQVGEARHSLQRRRDADERIVSRPARGLHARTRYGYDALGRLASVTDPRSLVTRYANNWLDLPEKITSPDAGVTTKTYDAAGNVLTSRDARGQTTTYLYDDLNRRVKGKRRFRPIAAGMEEQFAIP